MKLFNISGYIATIWAVVLNIFEQINFNQVITFLISFFSLIFLIICIYNGFLRIKKTRLEIKKMLNNEKS